MEGRLEELLKDQGSGVPLVETSTGREALGSGMGARNKLSLWMHIPPVEGKLKHALLTLGLEAPRQVATPIRVRVTLDKASVTREYKPQFSVGLDETIYYKAVYDVKPILASRIGKIRLHRLQLFYDLLHPIFFRDATLLVVMENPEARYALSMLTGAKSLEPGDVTVEYPPFYRSFGGARKAGMVIHSPYHDASFEVVVAGSRSEPVRGSGSHVVSVPFTYEGSLVPVSVRYVDPGYQYYPKRAILTDVYLEEVFVPRVELGVEVTSVSFEGGTVNVEASIHNSSTTPITGVIVTLLALGGQLAQKKFKSIEPGSSLEVRMRADISRLPIRPASLVLVVSGYAYGRRIEKTASIQLKG